MPDLAKLLCRAGFREPPRAGGVGCALTSPGVGESQQCLHTPCFAPASLLLLPLIQLSWKLRTFHKSKPKDTHTSVGTLHCVLTQLQQAQRAVRASLRAAGPNTGLGQAATLGGVSTAACPRAFRAEPSAPAGPRASRCGAGGAGTITEEKGESSQHQPGNWLAHKHVSW